MKKKVIITGAAGTGKTTLIDALRERGFNCLEEVSRNWINRQLSIQGDAVPWNNVKAFSDGCLKESYRVLEEEDEAAFCDRSPLDYHVHLLVRNETLDAATKTIPIQSQFETVVFYCPVWEAIYKQEPQRPEPFEHQLNVDKVTRWVYRDAKFELVEVPKVSVSERVSFVLHHLGEEKVTALKF